MTLLVRVLSGFFADVTPISRWNCSGKPWGCLLKGDAMKNSKDIAPSMVARRVGDPAEATSGVAKTSINRSSEIFHSKPHEIEIH